MEEWNDRTVRLIGEAAAEKLKKTTVAIFGLGGVGSYAAEAIARSGVGHMVIVDNDTVNVTNINRQLCALVSTIDRKKTSVTEDRIHDINPNAVVLAYDIFFSEETASQIDFSRIDYIIDAIDSVSSKLLLIETAKKLNIPIISCMGAGNKLDPTKFTVTDIYSTSLCPLARVMRSRLRKMGIESLKVVYSTEPAIVSSVPPASISFVPSVAGLICASEVISDIIK